MNKLGERYEIANLQLGKIRQSGICYYYQNLVDHKQKERAKEIDQLEKVEYDKVFQEVFEENIGEAREQAREQAQKKLDAWSHSWSASDEANRAAYNEYTKTVLEEAYSSANRVVTEKASDKAKRAAYRVLRRDYRRKKMAIRMELLRKTAIFAGVTEREARDLIRDTIVKSPRTVKPEVVTASLPSGLPTPVAPRLPEGGDHPEPAVKAPEDHAGISAEGGKTARSPQLIRPGPPWKGSKPAGASTNGKKARLTISVRELLEDADKRYNVDEEETDEEQIDYKSDDPLSTGDDDEYDPDNNPHLKNGFE